MFAVSENYKGANFPIALVLVLLILGVSLLLKNMLLFNQRAPVLDTTRIETERLYKEKLSQERRATPLHLPILMYHYVEVVTDLRDTIRQKLDVLPNVFEQQIKLMLSQGYTFVNFKQVADYYAGGEALPAKPVVLTFDDGYRDFYTDVFPILKKYRIKSVAYVVSGFMDSTKNYMTRAQVMEIAGSGLVEIGAHSTTHQYLPYLGYQEAREEIEQSKKDLEALIRTQVTTFAYPYGAYNLPTLQMVEQAGFDTAVGVEPGNTQMWDRRYAITRFRPGSTLGEFFLEMLR